MLKILLKVMSFSVVHIVFTNVNIPDLDVLRRYLVTWRQRFNFSYQLQFLYGFLVFFNLQLVIGSHCQEHVFSVIDFGADPFDFKLSSFWIIDRYYQLSFVVWINSLGFF